MSLICKCKFKSNEEIIEYTKDFCINFITTLFKTYADNIQVHFEEIEEKVEILEKTLSLKLEQLELVDVLKLNDIVNKFINKDIKK